jgi:hypothetical protein
MSEMPPPVREMAARARRLLHTQGAIRRDMSNKLMLSLGVPPLWLFGCGGDDGTLELYISIPSPDTPTLRDQIYEEGPNGHYWSTAACSVYLDLLRRRMVLDDLADIDA